MATLSSTRIMFNFVLGLYLVGFVVMVTRWTTDIADSECRERERRDDGAVHASTLQHLVVDAKIANGMPILNKDNASVSNEVKEQKSRKETLSRVRKAPVAKTQPFKKLLPPVKDTDKQTKQITSDDVPAAVQQKSGPHRKLTKSTSRKQTDEKTRWKADQARRKSTLRQACDLFDNFGQQSNVSKIIKSRKRNFWPFIVEDQYRLLYTFVSKVGSTNWKSVFLVLKGKYKTVEDVPGRFAHSPSLVKLSSLPEEGIKQRLDKYTNFIFVRHPFARVLSAYRSKFLQPNKAFQKGTGVRIIKMYRQNATKEALSTGRDVTFPEFIKYIVNAKIINFDGHWQPIYKMVLPCAVRFDYIGKLETGEEDAKYILHETHVDHLVHFKATTRNVSHDDTIFNHYYSQIPPADLAKLYGVYEPDFKLFGYEVPKSITSFNVT